MVIKNRIENFEEESRFKIRNQTFSNEIDLDLYIEWNALAGIIFIDCRFEELDLLGTIFGSCDFENCKFKNLSFQKCQFSNCRFQNYQIINSDLTRAQFDDSSFRNSQFLKSDLAASDFMDCEFVETKFKNSNLDLILAWDVKLWKSNKCIDSKESPNFGMILKDFNLTSNNPIENSDDLS
jgi:uncharacterized protein YjbI with pentapeptide repeats